jgi:hypothetical protein
MITPAQCRAARALLDWPREWLSTESGIGPSSIFGFEKGTRTPRSVIANAYQNWGTPIEAKDVRRGDVVITTRGKRPGQIGGHVSLATGPLDNDNEIPVIEGDTRVDPRRGGRHRVAYDWETPRRGLVFRRPPDQAALRPADTTPATVARTTP